MWIWTNFSMWIYFMNDLNMWIYFMWTYYVNVSTQTCKFTACLQILESFDDFSIDIQKSRAAENMCPVDDWRRRGGHQSTNFWESLKWNLPWVAPVPKKLKTAESSSSRIISYSYYEFISTGFSKCWEKNVSATLYWVSFFLGLLWLSFHHQRHSYHGSDNESWNLHGTCENSTLSKSIQHDWLMVHIVFLRQLPTLGSKMIFLFKIKWSPIIGHYL